MLLLEQARFADHPAKYGNEVAKASAYRQLVARYGAGKVADALLAKWQADPDAEAQWDMLADAIIDARPGVPRPMPKQKRRAA